MQSCILSAQSTGGREVIYTPLRAPTAVQTLIIIRCKIFSSDTRLCANYCLLKWLLRRLLTNGTACKCDNKQIHGNFTGLYCSLWVVKWFSAFSCLVFSLRYLPNWIAWTLCSLFPPILKAQYYCCYNLFLRNRGTCQESSHFFIERLHFASYWSVEGELVCWCVSEM